MRLIRLLFAFPLLFFGVGCDSVSSDGPQEIPTEQYESNYQKAGTGAGTSGGDNPTTQDYQNLNNAGYPGAEKHSSQSQSN